MEAAPQSPQSPLPEVVYTPASQLRQPALLIGSLFRDLAAARELGWRLLVRNISARYRQTMLGYIWAVLPPLAMTGIWVFLNRQRVVDLGFTLPPGVPDFCYLLTGLMLWQTFAEAIQTPLKVAEESKQMLSKINFPREALLLTAVGEVAFGFLVRAALLAAVFLAFQIPVSPWALLAPLGVVCVVGLGIMFGVLLVPAGMLYQDFSRGLGLILQLWMFVTPVLFSFEPGSRAAILNWINPVSPPIIVTRDWLLLGATQGSHLSAMAVIAAATAGLMFFGLIVYRLAMPILIERMSA